VQREHWEHVLNVYFFGLSVRAIRALLLLEVDDFGYGNCGVPRRRVYAPVNDVLMGVPQECLVDDSFFWNSRSKNEDDILWTFQEMTDTEILRLTHGSGRVDLCLFQYS